MFVKFRAHKLVRRNKPMRLTKTMFCVIYINVNHFKAHPMVPSKVVDSRVQRMVIQLEYFFFFLKKKSKMANVMLDFLFGMSLDLPAL